MIIQPETPPGERIALTIAIILLGLAVASAIGAIIGLLFPLSTPGF